MDFIKFIHNNRTNLIENLRGGMLIKCKKWGSFKIRIEHFETKLTSGNFNIIFFLAYFEQYKKKYSFCHFHF